LIAVAHSQASAQRIEAAQRRTHALQLRVEGKTYEQIGAALNVSTQRAHAIVTEELRRLNQERAEAAAEVTRLECERLDDLHASLWDKAIEGDLDALDRIIKLMARRARLLGLDVIKPAVQINVPAASQEQTHGIINDPAATELACQLFERIAAGPPDPRGPGVVRQPEAVDASEAPQPAEP
jgi:hypothetical protein